MNTEPGAATDLQSLPLPPGVPVLGNLLQLKPTELHLKLEEWVQQYGEFYRLKIASRSVLVVSDSHAIANILKARPETFRRFSSIETVFGDLGIGGLLSAEGDQWYRQRKLTMRAFDPGHLRRYFPSLVEITERLRQRWLKAASHREPIDILADLMCYSLDVTAGLAFGSAVNTIDGKDAALQRCLETIFPAINRRLNTPFPYWRYFKLPSDHELDRNLRTLRDTVDNFIEQTRARIKADPSLLHQPTNLIESFVTIRDQPDSEFTDEDVYGNVFTTLLVGADSTANVFAWISYFLCEDPSAQKALQDEADNVLAEQTVLQDFSRVSSLRYIEAAAQETMRLKPSGPVIFLEAKCEANVGHIRVASGTPILILMRPGGMDPKSFPEPRIFDPKRWLDEGGVLAGTSPKRIVMPFGAGPRLCPGRYLALLQIKMLGSMLGRNFKIKRSTQATIEERFKFTMEPVNLRVIFAKR